MLKLKLSPQAITDLEEIYEFSLTSWGLKRTEAYIDEMYDAMISICENPEIGSIYYFKEGNYRKLNINRHMIFYRFNHMDCIVLRILHERMDLKKKLK